jgi:hypothetical protein
MNIRKLELWFIDAATNQALIDITPFKSQSI